MKGFSKKRVFVTGATQGIGRAVAQRFLEEGACVLMSDVVDASVISDVVDALEDRSPGRALAKRVDILINNAGINGQSLSHRFTASDFDPVLTVNLRGAFLCSREALRLFVEQGSGIR